MNIQWNTVNWISQIVAIVLALIIFGTGFYLGQLYQAKAYENGMKAAIDELYQASLESSATAGQ